MGLKTRHLRDGAAALLMMAGISPLKAGVIEVGDDGVVRVAPMVRNGSGAMEPGAAQPALAAGSKRWTVQLGAYPSAELLQADWQDIAERSADLLQGYEIVQAEASVTGRRFLRLSATGFADMRTAVDLCGQLHMRGRDCFVRSEQR